MPVCSGQPYPCSVFAAGVCKCAQSVHSMSNVAVMARESHTPNSHSLPHLCMEFRGTGGSWAAENTSICSHNPFIRSANLYSQDSLIQAQQRMCFYSLTRACFDINRWYGCFLTYQSLYLFFTVDQYNAIGLWSRMSPIPAWLWALPVLRCWWQGCPVMLLQPGLA